MSICLAVLIGASVTVSPYIGIAIVAVPVVLGALNSPDGASPSTWLYHAVSSIPFILVTAVHSVLVFLFALATLDRCVWFEFEFGFGLSLVLVWFGFGGYYWV